MGKSSLLVRTIARLQAAGDHCAILDVTSIGQQQVTLPQWYRGVVADLTRSFEVFDRVHYKTWWQDQGDIPPVQKLQRFLRDVLLVAFPQDDLVICIDEIDSILSLDFSLDDFFALIRFCYNQRAIDPAYGRLTFAIFGVATPADLIQDRQVTPFNIGQAIALKGFRLDECQSLLQGLKTDGLDANAILQAILHWTGGQPFLTQKLCALVWECHHHSDLPMVIVPGHEAEGVVQLVHEHLIDQWEFQDEPEHLRTIQDRLLRHPDHRSRLFGQYQRILMEGSIPADGSPEQTTLLLSGLVAKDGEGLRVNNPIYGAVFNGDWVRHHLQAVRPYSEAIAAWLASDQQDASRLLRGQALRDAQAWSQDQRLGDDDYQFLAASVEADRQATQQALETERAAAIATQLQQSRRHTRLQRWLLGVVSAAFLVSSGLGLLALRQSQRANRSEQLARRSEIQAVTASAQGWFASFHRLDALLEAIRARQKLDQLQNPDPALRREVDDVLRKIIFGTHEVNRFSGHQGTIRAVAYRPDGEQIASASADGTIKLWQPDGTLLTTLPGHDRRVNAIAFSPEGDRLFSGGGDNSLKVWDATTGNELQHWEDGAEILSLAVSPQGDLLASGDIEGQIKLWRRDGTLIRTFSGHGAMVRSLAFDPEGQVLISASADSTLKLWRTGANDAGLIQTLTGHTATVTDVVFSPDGSRFASSSTDQTIRLWSRDGDSLTTLSGHRAAVATVRFSPDGQMLVSSSDDHDVRFWRMNGEPILAYSGITAVGSEIAFSPDGQYLASSGGGEDRAVVLWRLNSPLYSVFSGHQSSVIAIAISPDGQTLASTSSDRTIKLWRPDGTLLRTLEGHQAPVLDVDFSPDSQTLVSSSMDRTIRRWQLDGTPLGEVRPGIGSVAFSPDGQAIALTSMPPVIQLWQPDGSELGTFTGGHRGPIITLAWQHSGNQLASGGRDNTIQLWNVLTGEPTASLVDHAAPIWGLAFSNDDQLLASASEDHTVKLWDLSSGPAAATVTTLTGHTDQVRDVTFSPTVAAASQQPLLASASFDKTIKLWTLDGALVTTLDRHTARVEEVVFSPDSRFLFSASGDNTVIRWDLDAILQLDPLDYACDWVRDYLKTSPTLSPEDRQLCDP
jgi:WD40 repeat protein